MSTKLENAKAEKNQAQAVLYSIIALILVAVLIGAVIYIFGGWILQLIYKALVVTVYFLGLFFLAAEIFAKRRSLKDLADKYPTNRAYFHSILGQKTVEECTDEEKEKIKEDAIGKICLGYFVYGAMWFLPVLTGLNVFYQVFPLNLLAPVAIFFAFIFTLGGWAKTLLRLSKDQIDQPISPKWPFFNFMFHKFGDALIGVYYVSVGLMAFGVAPSLLLMGIIGAVIFFISIM